MAQRLHHNRPIILGLARRDEAWAPEIGEQGKDFWNLRMLAAANGGVGWADRLRQTLQDGRDPGQHWGASAFTRRRACLPPYRRGSRGRGRR
jgi:hypothetical protein